MNEQTTKRPRERCEPGRGTEVSELAIKPLASDESCFRHGAGGGMLEEEEFSETGRFPEYERVIVTMVVAHPP